MTTLLSINQKRFSSNLDAQQYEPPMKKSSFTSLPSLKIQDVAKIASSSSTIKKVFTRAPMGDFLTKCGLISRDQQVFEDIFINEDNADFLPSIPFNYNTKVNYNRIPYSTTSLDVSFACYCSIDKSSAAKSQMKQKCNSDFCLNETEQNNSSIKKQSQQQLLETRAREESSEFSMIGDEEDQIEGSHKCNFLTEQLEPSAQIYMNGSELAQPMVNIIEAAGNNKDNDEQENYSNLKAFINNNEEELNYNDYYDGSIEFKVIEFGSCI